MNGKNGFRHPDPFQHLYAVQKHVLHCLLSGQPLYFVTETLSVIVIAVGNHTHAVLSPEHVESSGVRVGYGCVFWK